MNCTACSKPIDKTKGYYLVMGAPYCTNCHKATDEAVDIIHWTHSPRRDPENLLKAFRAYQKRRQASACQSF